MNPYELHQVHVARSLSQYLPTLEYVRRVAGEGYLKDANPGEIQQYVAQLREHMAETGAPEDDRYLLQFGILVPGLQRGIRPPQAALGPARGGFSKPRLDAAAGAVRRVREALNAGRRLVGPLNADTSAACGELIASIQTAGMEQEDWIALHASLTTEEAEALVSSAITLLNKQKSAERDVAVEILSCLANFRRSGLDQSAGLLLDRGLFWPATLYRNAPILVSLRLVALIPKAKDLDLNRLLLALAWTRGEVAKQAFLSWRRNPQPWAADLHVPVEEYTHEGGWTIDAEGNRQELISLSCYAVVPKGKCGVSATPVPCRVPTGESCPGCKHPLAWLFDFSGVGDPQWSDDWAGAPRRVLFCPACACYTTIYSHYRPDGSSEWHPANELGASDGKGDWPPRECALRPTPRPPFAGQVADGREDSWLGGAPAWIDDAAYPACPDCKSTTKFLAQFDNSAGSQPEEGVYYTFYCEACQVAAVRYQQT